MSSRQLEEQCAATPLRLELEERHPVPSYLLQPPELCAGELSLELGLWSADDQRRQRAVIEAAGLPMRWPELDPQAVLRCLQGDKKVRDGRVRFVLPTSLGTVEIRSDVQPEQVLAALSRCA